MVRVMNTDSHNKFWKKSNDNNHKLITAIALMAIACYFVDAFFNFPAERTSMQTMFALSAALLFLPIYFTGTNNTKQKDFKGTMLLLIPLLLVVGAIYVNYQTYTSMDQVNRALWDQKDQLQCIVGPKEIANSVGFGQTQRPLLHEYADGIDPINFVLSLY